MVYISYEVMDTVLSYLRKTASARIRTASERFQGSGWIKIQYKIYIETTMYELLNVNPTGNRVLCNLYVCTNLGGHVRSRTPVYSLTDFARFYGKK